MPNLSFLCCLEVVVLWLETNNKQVSMKLMASLARAEIEAGVVAKADQYKRLKAYLTYLYVPGHMHMASRTQI